jgi:Mg-chelatase subunit ChlD
MTNVGKAGEFTDSTASHRDMEQPGADRVTGSGSSRGASAESARSHPTGHQIQLNFIATVLEAIRASHRQATAQFRRGVAVVVAI